METSERNKASRRGNVQGRVLYGILVLAVLGAMGMLGYTITKPAMPERFTEFYLLGSSGRAGDYPERVAVGEEGKVVVGIVNREQETVTYRVEVEIDGVISKVVEPMTLEHDEKWEEVVGFTPERAVDKQKVEFLLYKPEQSEAYHRLHLWLDIQ